MASHWWAVIQAHVAYPVIGAHDDLHLNDAALRECFKHRVDTVLLPILIGALGGGLPGEQAQNIRMRIDTNNDR